MPGRAALRLLARAAAAALALSTLHGVGGVALLSDPAPTGAATLDCSAATARTTIVADTTLDPSCAWSGVDIAASGVTLDCAGATIDGTGEGGRGIAVLAPVGTSLTDVTITDCHTRGFLNGIRVTRPGFRDLAPGEEYATTTARIRIVDSSVTASRGVGIFVDAYVSDVTIRDVEVRGAGSTGIYLEAGSRQNQVLDSTLADNGFTENGPEGQLFTLAGTTFRFWGTGREGLAIDGSQDNVVRGNRFEGNSAGGIFLYENCGEFATTRPETWWERRTGAEDNLIEANTFVGGRHGVWIGSRMGENTLPMDCSDAPYLTGPAESYVLDHAVRATVRGNTFTSVTYGVRVEDDDAIVEANAFSGPDPSHHAVLVGTRVRTSALGRPVRGTTVRANVSTIVGNTHPYRWVHGEAATTFEANTALGAPVGWCEAPTIPHSAFIFVDQLVVEDPAGPPTPRPEGGVGTLAALDACPASVGPPPPGTVGDPPPSAPPALAVDGAATFTG